MRSYQDAWALFGKQRKRCAPGNRGLSSHSEGGGKKGKVFGIVSQLKKQSKSNVVHVQIKHC